MIDSKKMADIVKAYKEYVPNNIKNEIYKWKAVKCFQDNWDIEAEDFAEMFEKATAKTVNLLSSRYYYPAAMIAEFARYADSEATRQMFVKLFDESRDLGERVDEFRKESERLRSEYGADKWKNHYQNANSISTYLWLRYPDKYYIYKYSECVVAAVETGSTFIPKRVSYSSNLVASFEFLDEICAYIRQDRELHDLLEKYLTADAYPDPMLKTMTIDVEFFISRFYHYRNDKSDWWPAENDYTPGLTKENWIDLLRDPEVFSAENLQIVYRMKAFGGMASCKQLALKYGKSANFYNSGSSHLAKRIHDKTGCAIPPSRDNENARWWPVLYVGKYASEEETGTYVWKLRSELSEALDEIDLTDIALYADESGNDIPAVTDTEEKAIEYPPYDKDDFLREVYLSADDYDMLRALLLNKKNIILQGAPGVGKTFAAKRLAYSIMGMKDDSHIEFVQFHQNYSYEDFIIRSFSKARRILHQSRQLVANRSPL